MLIKCDYCGKDKEMKPYKVTRSVHNYCSRECAQMASRKRVAVACDTCGKEVEKCPSEIVDGRGSYCSKSCAAKKNNLYRVRNWTDGKSSYAARARKEYGEVCNRCGYNEYTAILEVHHIDGNRNNNVLENLEVLCPNCHKIRHYVENT